MGLGALGLLGLLLLAVATLRARVLPRWGAWLVILTIPLGIVAVVLVLFIGTSFQGILQASVGVVLGLGFVAWGWALWSEKGEMVASETFDVGLIRIVLASGSCSNHRAG